MLAPASDLCSRHFRVQGKQDIPIQGSRVSTSATSVLAGSAAGDAVGGSHHCDGLIVLWPHASIRLRKCLLWENFIS